MLKTNQLRRKIEASEKVLLITHQNPDGDTLGASLAFFSVLKEIGKKVEVICIDKIPKLFSFLPNVQNIKRDFLVGDFDLIIILDCGDLKRTGFSHRLKQLKNKKKMIINIDHHPKNDVHRLASLNLVDYEASSTAELIYRIIRQWNIKINRDIATNLLCGIYTDTGAFQHSNTNSRVLQIASELMSNGAELKQISSNITNGKSITTLKLWGLVLSRVCRKPNLDLITSVVTRKDLMECKATDTDLAGAVNLINTIPGSTAAILFSETKDGKIRASLRTEKNNIDVSRLAQIFDGGGLKKASGFTIEGKIVKDKCGGWKIVDYKV